MSDIHILVQDVGNKTVSAVFHFPIPTGNNEVGIPWRTALVNFLGGADIIESVLSAIAEAELTKMKAGEVVEQSTTVRFSSVTLTNAQRLSQVQAAYTLEKAAYLAAMEKKLDFYGYGGDV